MSVMSINDSEYFLFKISSHLFRFGFRVLIISVETDNCTLLIFILNNNQNEALNGSQTTLHGELYFYANIIL